MNVDVNTCHRALLNLAEEFRTKSPPDHKSCVQCLLAILNLPVPPAVAAKTNYQIGLIIHKQTSNNNAAQVYLERSYELCQTSDLVHIRLEVAALLIDIYLTQNNLFLAKQLLSKAINDSSSAGNFLYWHYKFLLQLSQINLDDKDFQAANNLLTIGAEAARVTEDLFTRILFLLSKGMILMIARKYQDPVRNQQSVTPQQQIPNNDQQLVDTLALAGQLLESWQGDVFRKEALKVFFLVLQVCHHLNAGHVKSAKPCLKLLQQSMQNLTNATGQDSDTAVVTNHSEKFMWMPKDLMCVLVYLVTVIHSMQAGFLEKAQKYTEKALVQIDRLKVTDPEPLLDTFQILLLEHVSMCHLVMGNKSIAIRETVQALQLCYRGNPRLKLRHRGNIHTLLGLYAMSMSQSDDAVNQFNRVINDPNVNTELRVMAMLNLALCYLQTKRDRELDELLTRLNPEQLNSVSICLKAASYFVHGFNAFAHERYDYAKRNLREALTMANGEDLNRLTACSLVLLGNIFYNLGRQQDSFKSVTSGMQLATKIPDIHVQLWAASILKDIYARCGDQQRQLEAYNMHQNFSQRLYQDQYQASTLPEHNYLKWFDDS